MPKYGLIVCFSTVIKADIGEHNQRYRFGKNWELEKNGGFSDQKIAKTGNIGKKTPVAGDIVYVRYLSMQKVNLN